MAPATVQRSAAPGAHETTARATLRIAAQAGSERIARAPGGGPAAPAIVPAAPANAFSIGGAAAAPQLLAKVSSPGEPAELEAEHVARNVVKMGVPLSTPRVDDQGQHAAIHRSADGAEHAPPVAPVDVGVTGGSPLPAGVRGFMEPRFGADFSKVRIHTDEAAAQQSADLQAHAFTVGQHIFFGRGQYQPDSARGKELIAHELTHTVQQGAAVQHGGVVHRSADPTVTQRSEPRVQRLGIGDALNTIADKANYIPGFRLLTIVLGMNPVNQAPVERSAANILRAILELIPVTGALLAQALENHGIFAKVAAWFDAQVRSLGMVGSAFKQGLDKFLDSLNWRDIFDLGGVWERAKRIFTDPIDRLIAFGRKLATDIVGFVREAILLPLAKLAEGARGYDLLKAVLGQDPITGQPCPRNADTLIGGFMKLIGQEEVWENLKKANAVARAFAWFQGALAGLLGFVRQIPVLARNAFKALEIVDLIVVPRAFAKIAGVFGGFITSFVKWAGGTVLRLLEIIFEVVSPATLVYLKKTGAALLGILKNPLPFVRNMVSAAKLGFQNFADKFFGHLKAGLIDWLTGSLEGVYIPKALSLVELGKFAISVLGISWAQIRGKIVKVLGPSGETIMKALETGFDVVVALVKGGPAAAWELIKEKLSDLKDQVVNGIVGFVTDIVVKKAIPKLLSLFIPGAGFVSAIISIYDTIMVFVEKISKIIQVVTAFLDSIVAIAAGNITAAADRVERILANFLSLAVSFLAGFLGLGKVTAKIKEVIEKVRALVDKAIDAAIAWIVDKAKKQFAKLFGKKDERTEEQKNADLSAALRAATQLLSNAKMTPKEAHKQLDLIKVRYKLTSLTLVVDSQSDTTQLVHVEAEINPKGSSEKKPIATVPTYMGARKSGATFEGHFGHADWKWTGYPPTSVVALHPANPELGYQNNTSVSKPTGTYKVSGGTAGAPVPQSWRDKLTDMKDGYKAKLMAPPRRLDPGPAENAAKRQVEADYASRGFSYGWLDLNLYDTGPSKFQGHHIHPINWQGKNVAANLQYIPQAQHSTFTTWWEARKSEVTAQLNKE